MLRSTRVLLLLAIVLILGAVGATYYRQKSSLRRHAPAPPKSLPLDTAATASSWVYTKYDGKRLVAEVRAKNFRQLNEPDRVELEQVDLRLFKPDGARFDHVLCAQAQLDKDHDTLFSDGEVAITMGVPIEGPPHGRLLTIRSSGVSFDVKTGRAATDREASFTFDLGEGKAVGAVYDPTLRELLMKSQVELHWRGSSAKTKPMKLEAGELAYRERDAVVLLPSWSRLTRENTELNANDSVVTLQDGMIRKVEGKQARGAARYPNRQVEYAADGLLMNFNEDGEAERVVGDRNARLVSTSDTARTTVTSDRMELDFEIADGESTLKKARATGHGFLESVPVPRKDAPTPESRLLRSEAIDLTMRPGGREIASVRTDAPGHLEFLPNRPEQRHRTLDAERMTVVYGANNQIESFSAYQTATQTDPQPRPAKEKQLAAPPIRTWSKDLAATFDPKTGQLARLEQWTDFRYEEGERKGRAHRAVLEEARNVITLEQGARVWDAGGSTAADRIVLDQKSGDVAAQGNVVSTRLPDKKGQSSAMLSNDEPLNAKAGRMQTTERNLKIHYEGQAMAWQGANRIWADQLDIDRAGRRLTARGAVRTQFLDQQKNPPPAAAGAKPTPRRAPAVIGISSAALVYTEADRLAHYTGGTHLIRPGMDVKATEIRAYLNDNSAESSLDRAYADGHVEILRTEPGRTLKGTSEHAEYFTADQKIVLTQGDPTMTDSARGYSKGRQLTYWANDDKLLVNGMETQPAKSLIKRR